MNNNLLDLNTLYHYSILARSWPNGPFSGKGGMNVKWTRNPQNRAFIQLGLVLCENSISSLFSLPALNKWQRDPEISLPVHNQLKKKPKTGRMHTKSLPLLCDYDWISKLDRKRSIYYFAWCITDGFKRVRPFHYWSVFWAVVWFYGSSLSH